MTANFIHPDDHGVLIEVDLGIYGLKPLLKVAYKFTGRGYLHLQFKTPAIVEVRLRTKDGETKLDTLAGEFCNELLDQTLRAAVASESEGERNLILAHALSRTELLHPEMEVGDPFSGTERIGA